MSHHLPDTLTHTLSSHFELGKPRLQTLSWMIIGRVNARTVNLSHLASQCSASAQVSSSYRRLQRFFQYVTLGGRLVDTGRGQALEAQGALGLVPGPDQLVDRAARREHFDVGEARLAAG